MGKLLWRSCSVEVIILRWVTGRDSQQTWHQGFRHEPTKTQTMQRHKTFPLHRVFMDQHGDVEGNYTLVSAQPLKGGGVGLLPTGRCLFELFSANQPNHPRFYLASQLNLNVRAQPLPLLRIEPAIIWPGGSPPRDRPKCGFQGEACPRRDQFWSFSLQITFSWLALGELWVFHSNRLF